MLLAALAPLSIAYLAELWRQPSYWAPMLVAIPAAAILMWSRHEEDDEIARSANVRATTVLFGSVLVLVAAFLGSSWIGFLSLLVAASAGALSVGGRDRFERVLAASLVLLPLLHLPFGISQAIETSSRTATARGADKLLDLWSVFHVTQGGAIAVSDRTLVASEPGKTGFALMMVACASAFVMGVMRRPTWLTAVVLLFVPICVVATESVRLAGAARIVDQLHRNANEGILHAVLMTASLSAAVVLALSAAECIQAIALVFRRTSVRQETQRPTKTPPTWMTPSLCAVAVVALALQLPQLYTLVSKSRSSNTRLGAVDESTAPTSFLGSPPPAFRSEGVAGASTWVYSLPNGRAELKVNARVSDWHEPFIRYRDAGWIIGERRRFSFSVDGKPWSGVEAKLTKPSTGRTALVLLTLSDSQDQPAPGASFVVPSRTIGELSIREILNLLTTENDDHGPYVGVQLFAEGQAPVENAAAEAACEFFADACRRILEPQVKSEAAP